MEALALHVHDQEDVLRMRIFLNIVPLAPVHSSEVLGTLLTLLLTLQLEHVYQPCVEQHPHTYPIETIGPCHSQQWDPS